MNVVSRKNEIAHGSGDDPLGDKEETLNDLETNDEYEKRLNQSRQRNGRSGPQKFNVNDTVFYDEFLNHDISSVRRIFPSSIEAFSLITIFGRLDVF